MSIVLTRLLLAPSGKLAGSPERAGSACPSMSIRGDSTDRLGRAQGSVRAESQTGRDGYPEHRRTGRALGYLKTDLRPPFVDGIPVHDDRDRQAGTRCDRTTGKLPTPDRTLVQWSQRTRGGWSRRDDHVPGAGADGV